MILSCQNIGKSFGSEKVLEHVSFHIEENEKVAIVGINGAGKSTLLKIIIKALAPDEGEVVISKNKTIGYLAQHQNIDSQHTVYEEVLSSRSDILKLEEDLMTMEKNMHTIPSEEMDVYLERYHRAEEEFSQKGGYSYRSEVSGVIRGLGFEEEEFQLPIQNLSGGQKTRVSLGKLLVTKPDVLILDEPTNHLDLNAISWLENYLLNYNKAVIIVSHDRYFLNKIVSKVIELFHHKSMVFQGNYDEYSKKKEDVRFALLKAYENQQREIKHQEEVITKLKSFNREKSIKRAESREKMLEKVERIDRPMEENTELKISLEPSILSGQDVLTVKGLAKSFDRKSLFSGIDFEIKRKDRVALIGDNGTGKTTLLKILTNLIQPDSGTIELGSNVVIGYYDQEHNVLHEEKTLFAEISDDYPFLTQTQIRNVLAAFLFLGDDVFKRIMDLSGGEKGRVSLAKLMLSEANFLILDEPTNHLDIVSKEILEEALIHYTGTVLFVSHDRYFINKTGTRILELTNERIIDFPGNYDYFLEKYEVIHQRILNETSQMDTTIEEPVKNDWKAQKEEQAKARKRAKDLEDVENRIHRMECRIVEIEELMCLEEYVTNSAKLNEFQQEIVECNQNLNILFEKWETLAQE